MVLRYWEDPSDAQVAAALGCAEGTVRSQASRALAKLRGSAALALPPGTTLTRLTLEDRSGHVFATVTSIPPAG